MTLKQLLDYYDGNRLAIALAIGYTEPAIRHWENKGAIPYKAQRIIEAVTNGKLVAKPLKAKPSKAKLSKEKLSKEKLSNAKR
jgi:hypothetical protein